MNDEEKKIKQLNKEFMNMHDMTIFENNVNEKLGILYTFLIKKIAYLSNKLENMERDINDK